MAGHLSGRVVLAFSKKHSKGLLGERIFLARDGPTSVKNLLSLLAISVSRIIYSSLKKRLRGSFDLLC